MLTMLFTDLLLKRILTDMKFFYNNAYFQLSLMLIISTLFFISCNSTSSKEIKELNTIIANNIGKEVNIPNHLQIYKPFKNYILDSAGMFNSNFKIYSYVNASCGTCVSSINEWKHIILEFNNQYVSVILIFKSDDNFELLKYLCETGEIREFPYPFFFDKNKEFPKINSFILKHKHLQTILVDENNKILLLGNPIQSSKIKELYMKTLNK
jgi:hypothetical protein